MFSINTLKENNNTLNINNITENSNKSYLFDLLESNDIIHDIMSSINCDMYINATNSILTETSMYQEGVLSTIKEKISNMIQALIDFITKFTLKNNKNAKFVKEHLQSFKKKTNNFSGSFYEDDYNSFIQIEKGKYPNVKISDDEIKKAKEQTIQNFNNKELKFNVPVFILPNIADINDKCVEPAITNFIKSINEILDGKSPSTPTKSQLDNAFGVLAKNIKGSRNNFNKPVTDRKSFQEYIKGNVAYMDQKSKTFEELSLDLKKYEEDFNSDYFSTYLKKDLDDIKNKARNVVDSLSDENIKNYNIYFEYTRQIVNAYIWCQNYINNMQSNRISRYINICKDIQYNRLYVNPYKNASQNESSYIHGEPFNSDTLFDNEDLRDFNRTEWLDLELTTECYSMKYDMIEAQRRAILQEALILTDDKTNKIKRLIAMKEAENGKLTNSASNIIANIRKIIDKFLSTIKDKYGNNAQFLRQYEKEIDKPINKDAKIVSKGDILAGMYRIQDNINFVDYNYDTLKDDLQDKETFFKKHILNTLNSNSNYSKIKNNNFENGMNITDYCKAYYGASVAKEDDKGFEFTGAEIETNKSNIKKFLQNSNTFINSIKSDINKLEEQSKKISVNQSNNQQNSTNTNNQNNSSKSSGETKQESYYSLIYNKYITEADIDMGTTNNSDGNNNEENNKNNTEASAFKVYMDAYKDVLLSKITAIEFIVSELMQILKAHVGVKDAPKENNNQNNENNQEKK